MFPHVKGGPKATILASSPFTAQGPKNKPVTDTQQTVLCQYPSGAWVFDAGTFHWNHGLSTPGFVDPADPAGDAESAGPDDGEERGGR